MLDSATAALDFDRNVLADHAIENFCKRNECGDEFTVDANEYVSRLHFSSRRGFRNNLTHSQHAGVIWIHGTDQFLRFGGQAKAAQFIEGASLEYSLQCSACDCVIILNQLQCPCDAIQRQEEAACSVIIAAGIQRNYFTLDIDNGRTR